MNTLEEKLKNLQTIHLPKEARIRMREELVVYAELHSVLKSPIQMRKAYPRLFRMYGVLAAVVLIIGSAGATTYAAEDALPGDVLYTVKTKISEPVQTALIPSVKGKAVWHSILAERRLEEAVQLASEERLTPDTQEELAANLELHVQASVENANELENTGDSTDSLDVQNDLEARLTAHEHILSVMAARFTQDNENDTNPTDNPVRSLLAVVEHNRNAIEASRLALEDSISESGEVTASDDTATSTPVLAVAKMKTRPTYSPQNAPAAYVVDARAVRTEEVQSILSKHATLLAKFMPIASTTATSTATTTVTATTTMPIPENHDGDEDKIKMLWR